MTYDLVHVLLTVKGKFGGAGAGPEDWMVTFKLAPVTLSPLPIAALPAFLTAIKPAVVTFHNNVDVSPGTDCYLTELNAAVIGIDGRYAGGGTQATTIEPVSPPDAGPGAATLPWSTACAYTLQSARIRGRASKGRFFYPATGTAMTGTGGKWASTTGTNRATAARTLVVALNAAADPALGTGCKVQVMSNIGSGISSPVTSVRVGSKPDRQERRESTLNEDYAVSAPIP